MALKKQTNNTAFEQEPTTGGEAPFDVDAQGSDNSTTATATRAEKETRAERAPADELPDAAAKVAATTAIAKASTTSLSVDQAKASAKAFQKEVDDMKGSCDFAFGNYRVFKANNGEIMESNGDKDKLGRWAQVRLIGWDEHFEISPGEDGASTKDFVAYSKDGKTIDSVIGEDLKEWVGKPVADYVEYLRNEEEFDKTKCRRFVDTACALLATESSDGPVGTVIQITLSESSIPAFKRYQEQLSNSARCVAMGLPGFKVPEDPFTFFFIRENAEKGNKNWTKLKIAQDLPAKV